MKVKKKIDFDSNGKNTLNKKLYVVQFPEGKLSYCWGELIKINNYEIILKINYLYLMKAYYQ